MEADILYLQELLKARYVGSYEPGHMGAEILRFKKLSDASPLVVKITRGNKQEAVADIRANIIGYDAIRQLGGGRILPPDLEMVPLAGATALAMKDLGASWRQADPGITGARSLWRAFKDLVISTKSDSVPPTAGQQPIFVETVLSALARFDDDSFGILDIVRQSGFSEECGQSALMLLDFTPDNLFYCDGSLSFIDPWQQETYLGNPAVSIGQFSALVKIYDMSDSVAIAHFLNSACVTELPALLNGSSDAVEQSLRLGATLQLAASAFVRRQSDSQRSEKLRQEARSLWT